MAGIKNVAEPDNGAVQLRPSASISLRFGGVMVTGNADSPERPAGLDDLELLLRLSGGPAQSADLVQAVAVSAGIDAGAVEYTLDDLRSRGLLLPGTATPRPPASVSLAPTNSVDWPTNDDPIVLATPTVLRPIPTGFLALDHLGRRTALLTSTEVLMAAVFTKATTLTDGQEAADAHVAGPNDRPFKVLVGDLLAQDLLRVVDRDQNATGIGRDKDAMRAAVQYRRRLQRAVDSNLADLDIREAAVEARTGIRRTPVIPVHDNGQHMPLGLGMIMSALHAHTDSPIAEWFQIRPDWVANRRGTTELTARPAVYLFSNYMWSHSSNLAKSAAIKSASPNSLTIHGGPDTPKHHEDVATYFEANPHADVAAHGEGEYAVVEILEALGRSVGEDGPTDLSVLHDVAGLSFRDDGQIIHTAPRERLSDLNVIPSPFLAGLFEAYRGLPGLNVVLETNRGCPYGCTFCDWGTVTNARIRKFDMDRVLAELEWSASAGAQGLAFADANFGIFKRDVEIARTIVDLRAVHGSPVACSASYAKNTVKHLSQIISLWVGSGMLTYGVLSLQTMDVETLAAVNRSNIKTEKYDLIARQFRELQLPLYIDLMMGLPGATLGGFVDDLQNCIEREVQAKIHETKLLPNSPMNEPSYRAEHSIQIRANGPIGSTNRNSSIVSTSSMTEEDMARAMNLKTIFLLGENFGVLRHLSRHLRHETGFHEIDLYQRLLDLVDGCPEQWPAVDFMTRTFARSMVPPVSWTLLIEEVREVLVHEFEVGDTSALQTVVDVQLALLPSVGRPRSITLELSHDYAQWHAQMLQAKLDTVDWTTTVAPLGEFPPATFTVDDPLQISEWGLGAPLAKGWFDSWDLKSPVARPSILGGELSKDLAKVAG